MNRAGFLIQVRRDKIADYKKLHQAVWPEMLAALTRSGRKNYSLFLRPDGLVFGYFETDEEISAVRARLVAEPAFARWQVLMADFLEPIGNHPEGLRVMELQEVFHLD